MKAIRLVRTICRNFFIGYNRMEGKHSHVDSEKVILAIGMQQILYLSIPAFVLFFKEFGSEMTKKESVTEGLSRIIHPKMGVANTLSINLPKQHEISFSVYRSL